MSTKDPFVRWISGDGGSPAGFIRDDNSRGSIATYPESPDEPFGGIAIGAFEVRHQGASYPISMTPAPIIPDTLITQAGLIEFDENTGVVTIGAAGVYVIQVMANAASSNQRTLYFHAEIDNGAGLLPARWTARQSRISANQNHQSVFVSTNYFAKGTRFLIYLWASANDVSLLAQDLPGFEGVYTVPAVRMMITGSR